MTDQELCSNLYKTIVGAMHELDEGNELNARILLLMGRQTTEREMRERKYPPFDEAEATTEAPAETSPEIIPEGQEKQE